MFLKETCFLPSIYIQKNQFAVPNQILWAGRSAGRSLPWHGRGLGFKSRPVHPTFPLIDSGRGNPITNSQHDRNSSNSNLGLKKYLY